MKIRPWLFVLLVFVMTLQSGVLVYLTHVIYEQQTIIQSVQPDSQDDYDPNDQRAVRTI